MQQNLFTPYLLPTFEVPINLINLEDYYRPIREQLEELQAKYDDLKTENEELHKTLDKLKKVTDALGRNPRKTCPARRKGGENGEVWIISRRVLNVHSRNVRDNTHPTLP